MSLRLFADMASKFGNRLIAVCQMTSTCDKENNLKTVEQLIEKTESFGAKIVFFPECFDYVGENREQTISLAESLNGSTISRLRQAARDKQIWLSLGGFHEKSDDADISKIFNSHVLIDNKGEVAAVYRKTHLFDVDIPGGTVMTESEYVNPGMNVVKPISSPVGNIGLQICYDVRFPELSISLRQMGADILTFPSAFSYVTGMAHWEVLLRARAIDTQCYVVAAAQVGSHNKHRRSYGHSMVIDPWGAIIAQCSEGEYFCLADINLDSLGQVRKNMPLWKHRRYDLYNNPLKI